MRTLFAAYRVSDLERSLEFYTSLGYRELGRVAFDDGGRLAVLSFPGESVATLELVHRPEAGGVQVGGFDHLAIQTDDLVATLATLTGRGLAPGPPELPGGPEGPRTAWLEDPDGYRIELVEWPPGHPYGLTVADFSNPPTAPKTHEETHRHERTHPAVHVDVPGRLHRRTGRPPRTGARPRRWPTVQLA